MKKYGNWPTANGAEERVWLGAVGAFLFALAGGALYVLLSQAGMIAVVSGYVAMFCAFKGYKKLGKAESKRGVILSAAITVVILALAWYIGFCVHQLVSIQDLFEQGEIESVPTFFEYIPYSFHDMKDTSKISLWLSLGFAALECWLHVSELLRVKEKPKDQPKPEVKSLHRIDEEEDQ